MKQSIWIIIGLLVLLLMVNSCIEKRETDISLEIAIWGNIKEVKIIKESVKLFNKKYPDIYVDITHAPQGNIYIDRILTRAASGSVPDVMFCEVNFIDQFIDKGMLMDISQFLKKDKEISESDYFKKILNRFKRKNRLYGLPRDVAPFACIYYNKNLFNEMGVSYPKDAWNMNQFLEIAQKLTKRDSNGDVVHYGFYGWSWQNFVYAFGGRIVDNVDNPKQCFLYKKNAIDGIKFYHDLIYKYKVMAPPSSIEMGYNEMFMTGKIAMYGSGIWETPVFRDIKNFKWDVVMFPKGPQGKRGFATGGSGYAVSSSTKHPKLAYELLKIIAGEYGQKKLAQSGLAQPALKQLADSSYWSKDKKSLPANKGMLNEAVQYIIFNPYLSNWSEIEQKIINPRIDLVVRDRIEVKEAMNAITKDINNILKKR